MIKVLIQVFLFVAFVNCHNFSPDGDQLIPEIDAVSDDRGLRVWPHPQEFMRSPVFYTIDPKSFTFIAKTTGTCEILTKAMARYKLDSFISDCSRLGNKRTLNEHPHNLHDSSGKLMNATVTIKQKCEIMPHMFMDEKYSLTIDNMGVHITSDSVWGALRGLETFSQLTQFVGNNTFAVNKTTINDFPRFSHRGLLLDTSRHFLPLHAIYETLDALTYNKMNVFHWHIVDDQSFPYVSKHFPNLSLKGAYFPDTHIYTPVDVKNVIEYARLRGIRVLVEFDTPGHTQSWGKGQPGLLTQCYSGHEPNGRYGPINPINEANYAFIKDLFTEVTQTFPDHYFHVGGDEVDFGCWRSNPHITEWMQTKHIAGNYQKLEEYYIQKVLDIVKGLNRSYIVWQEVFDNHVVIKPDTVVHVWKGNWESEMHNVTSKGFHSLLSSCWYLDYISTSPDWRNYYKCDPHKFSGTDAQKKLVQGGEACIWGEWVDATNLISRTWPRASAVAERLWSPQSLTEPNAAIERFEMQHCRMLQRGLRVEPGNGPGACVCDFAE